MPRVHYRYFKVTLSLRSYQADMDGMMKERNWDIVYNVVARGQVLAEHYARNEASNTSGIAIVESRSDESSLKAFRGVVDIDEREMNR